MYSPPPPEGEPAPGVQPAERLLYAQTDADGNYRFEAAPIGDFALAVANEAIQATVTGRVDQPGQQVEVDVPFPALGRVGVTVLQDGQAAAGIQLQISGENFLPVIYGATGADGRYLSSPLPMGTVTVLVYRGDGTLIGARGDLEQDGQVLELSPEAPRTGRIAGMVRATDGSPLANVSITARDPVTNTAAYAQTDAQGAYVLDSAAETGEAGVRVQAAHQSGVTAGALVMLDASGADTPLDLTLPLAPVRVSVRTAEGAAPDETYSFGLALRGAIPADPSGLIYADALGSGEFLAYLPVPTPTFKARAEFYATGLVAAVEGSLPEGATSVSLTLVLPPVGRINGSVVDASGRPAAYARIGIRPAGGSEQPGVISADEAGRFTLWPVPYGLYVITAAQTGGVKTEVRGELSSAEQAVILTLPQPGTVEVTPGVPSTFGYARLFPADEPQPLDSYLSGGVYRFEMVPPGLFTVLESQRAVIGGRVGQGEIARLAFPAPEAAGWVYGRVFASDGVTPLPGANLEVAVASPVGMSRYIARTSPGGYYLVRGVQAGPVCASVQSPSSFAVVAGASGTLPAGGTLRLDLRNGVTEVSRLPGELNGLPVNQGLQLAEAPFRADLRLRVNGMSYPDADRARITSGGGGLEVGPAPVGGALVERRLYAPVGAGWIRYLEVLHNPGSNPLELLVEIAGSAVGAAAINSSGVLPAGPADRWVAVGGIAGRPALAFVFGGGGTAEAPVPVSFKSDERHFVPAPAYRYGRRLALAPGGRAAYLHYVVVGASADPGPAAQLAAALSDLTAPGALDGIDPETRAAILNFPAT